ncbi:MAG: DNA helicase [Lysobacterales bacterium 63-13]|nr:MAG: DNA helicase [Xanthomonadales bacterium 63-13]
MNFRIADTFTDSLGRLTGDEQKSVKTTAFDLQLNPTNPGMNFHKLDRAKDPNFWSVRVSSDIRLIVHKTATSLLLCYVDHHDQAYRWAERRKLETHPRTGAAQLVEIRERIEEVAVRRYIEVEQPVPARQPVAKPALFVGVSDDELLGYGVPVEWLQDVHAANEDTLLDLADHLPAEASEALLELATGGRPREPTAEWDRPALCAPMDLYDLSPDDTDFCSPATPVLTDTTTISTDESNGHIADPAESSFVVSNEAFEHPDAQRRFRTLANVEELEAALAYPWEKWTTFLHPAQREWVERDYNGPARVSGSAGTGKTIVALHRAVHLARVNPDARVLLATFSPTLARALHTKLRRLISSNPKLAERIDVQAMDAVGERLYERQFGRPGIATREQIREILDASAAAGAVQKFSPAFLLAEWENVVDAWQLDSWEAYRDVRRLGRKTRLPEAQRSVLWAVFERTRLELKQRGLVTHAGIFDRLAAELAKRAHAPFDFAVIDEAQDISVAQLRFLAALGGERSNALFFAGDLGQRIFQQPFSWKALGVDIRGRARTLHINYRTSHQIRMQADRLLGPEVSDVDGNSEERRGTVSVFNGAVPVIRAFSDAGSEVQGVAAWLTERAAEGVLPNEMGVFVRSAAEMDRAISAVETAGLPFRPLDGQIQAVAGHVSISEMHLAKGLEFRAVVVMACDDEVIPLQSRIESVADDADLEEVYNTERHLLYVACTRARDYLWVSGIEPMSEFLDDLTGSAT